MSVAASDLEASARVSSSSISDGAKNGPPSQSVAQKTNSASQQQSNLPPRLQKKQRQAEEENYLKYYKPMDYMRQTNSYHRKVAGDGVTPRSVDSARPNDAGSSRRVRDVNSRGNVTNRTLWTDNLTSVANGRSNGSESTSGDGDGSLPADTKTNFSQSNTGNGRLPDSTACEPKAPVTVLTSSSNKVTALETGVASLSLQSAATNHTMSQPSYVCPVSASYSCVSVNFTVCILWLLLIVYIA